MVDRLCSLTPFPADYNKETEFGRLFLFLSPVYYTPLQMGMGILQKRVLEKIAGPFEKVPVDQIATIQPSPPSHTPAPATIRISTASSLLSSRVTLNTQIFTDFLDTTSSYSPFSHWCMRWTFSSMLVLVTYKHLPKSHVKLLARLRAYLAHGRFGTLLLILIDTVVEFSHSTLHGATNMNKRRFDLFR